MSKRSCVLFLLACQYGAATPTEMPAAARCCRDPALLADAARGLCVDALGRAAGDMAVTCASNFTMRAGKNGTHIEIKSDGRIFLAYNDDQELEMPLMSFCLGNTTANSSDVWQTAMLCEDQEEETGLDDFTASVLMLVSIPFLLLTIIVYAVLPELRDLQGKSIICLCCSLTMSLGVVSYNKLFEFTDMSLCAARVFVGNYFIMAMFFWMNAITVQVFRGVRHRTEPSAHAFAWYSLFAWGLAAFILAVTLATNYIPGPHVAPGIGHNTCWFTGNREAWLYFSGPMAISSVANCVLFVWTSVVLWRQVLGATQLKALRYKFLISLRLFVVMGIGWLCECLSFLHGQYSVVWMIMDAWNVLQGVLIFIFLVLLRKRALRGLLKRNYTFCLSAPLKRYLRRSADDEADIADATQDAMLGSHGLTEIKP